MDRISVISELASICVEELNVGEKEVTEAKTFLELGTDSINSVNIMAAVEDLYQLEITDDELKSIVTVRDMVDLILKKAKT